MRQETIYARSETVGPIVANYRVRSTEYEVYLSAWHDSAHGREFHLSKQDAIETARAILNYFNEEL